MTKVMQDREIEETKEKTIRLEERVKYLEQNQIGETTSEVKESSTECCLKWIWNKTENVLDVMFRCDVPQDNDNGNLESGCNAAIKNYWKKKYTGSPKVIPFMSMVFLIYFFMGMV